MINILIACEESQTVCMAFRKRGFKERQKNRSKTFPGIANAMAEQWGSFIKNKYLSNT